MAPFRSFFSNMFTASKTTKKIGSQELQEAFGRFRIFGNVQHSGGVDDLTAHLSNTTASIERSGLFYNRKDPQVYDQGISPRNYGTKKKREKNNSTGV